jgi:antitoxin (DNA-binding transcriptional repressor) of toxin-antitoxin stability system
MKRISIRELQHNIGMVSVMITKGEKILLTKYKKGFAIITPIDEKRKRKRGDKFEEY